MDNISLLGVVAGGFTLFFLGAAWYTFLFGRAYREELGVPEPDPDQPPQPPAATTLGGQLLAGLVMSAVLAGLVGRPDAVSDGTLTGVAAGVLVAAALGQFWLFEGRTVRHLAINVGYIVAGLTLVGTILGALQSA